MLFSRQKAVLNGLNMRYSYVYESKRNSLKLVCQINNYYYSITEVLFCCYSNQTNENNFFLSVFIKKKLKKEVKYF